GLRVIMPPTSAKPPCMGLASGAVRLTRFAERAILILRLTAAGPQLHQRALARGLRRLRRRAGHGQAYVHGRAFAHRALDRHGALVKGNEPLDQRKPEAGPLELPRIIVLDLREGPAEPAEVILGDADAVVTHPEVQARTQPPRPHRHI